MLDHYHFFCVFILFACYEVDGRNFPRCHRSDRPAPPHHFHHRAGKTGIRTIFIQKINVLFLQLFHAKRMFSMVLVVVSSAILIFLIRCFCQAVIFEDGSAPSSRSPVTIFPIIYGFNKIINIIYCKSCMAINA